MKSKFYTCALAMLALFAQNVSAQTATNTTKATATLSSSCRLSATNANFGNYDPIVSSDSTTTAIMTIYCTKGTAWNFYEYAYYYYQNGVNNAGVSMTTTEMNILKSLSNSTGYASAMISNGNRLFYQVQMSDGVWDNDVDMSGRSNSGHYLGTGTGQNQDLSINFRIPKNQYVPPGSYADNVGAYIAFKKKEPQY